MYLGRIQMETHSKHPYFQAPTLRRVAKSQSLQPRTELIFTPPSLPARHL
jgi:hypothetical protein